MQTNNFNILKYVTTLWGVDLCESAEGDVLDEEELHEIRKVAYGWKLQSLF